MILESAIAGTYLRSHLLVHFCLQTLRACLFSIYIGQLGFKETKISSVNFLNWPRLAGYLLELLFSGLARILDMTRLDFLTWLLFTHFGDIP